jgi:hypothetical protein
MKMRSPGISEFWTDTRCALVLSGDPSLISAIADGLGLPRTVLVRVSPRRSGLALWGEALDCYRAYRSAFGTCRFPIGRLDRE